MGARWLPAALAAGVLLVAADARAGCDPGELEASLRGCGIDVVCIQRVMAECTPAGGAGPALPTPPLPAPPPGGEALLPRPAPPSPGGGGGFEPPVLPDPDETIHRIGEQTVLPASWLQTFQEGLVACAADAGCWGRELTAGLAHAAAYCGGNMMSERGLVCRVSAQYEVHVEAAIAQQRLARRGVRPDLADPDLSPPDPGDPVEDDDFWRPDPESPPIEFTPKVGENRVRNILDRRRRLLEAEIPADALRRVSDQADAYPLRSDPGTPALIAEETEREGFPYLEVVPTRRDWAYAMIGNLLLQAGLDTGGEDGRDMIRVSFWCAVRAAQLVLEPEHLSDVGFHLNLVASLKEAHDVLVFASQRDRQHPDVHNNLAFTLSAMGQTEDAVRTQEVAYRADPTDPHIRSRMDAMTPGELQERPDAVAVPPGWDFGEAYFRLAKRHALREYWGTKRWMGAREQALLHTQGGEAPGSQYFGWYEGVGPGGPAEWYSGRLADIEDSLRTCTAGAPEIKQACPLARLIFHPRLCQDAPTKEEVRTSKHNYDGYMCRCRANDLLHRASALNAYVDDAQAVWQAYEKEWYPKLVTTVPPWSSDLRCTNARYPGDVYQHPVRTGYAEWLDIYAEDSEEFWNEYLPERIDSWHDLKSSAQSLEACKATLPPPRPKPVKPEPPAPEKVPAWGLNLGVIDWQVRLDGSYSVKFDLGIIKGGYEKKVAGSGQKFEIGTGPVVLTWDTTNRPPHAGGTEHKVGLTGTLNVFEFLPGAAKPLKGALDSVFSIGGKWESGWSSRTGLYTQPKYESKWKIGFVRTEVPVPRYSRLQN